MGNVKSAVDDMSLNANEDEPDNINLRVINIWIILKALGMSRSECKQRKEVVLGIPSMWISGDS